MTAFQCLKSIFDIYYGGWPWPPGAVPVALQLVSSMTQRHGDDLMDRTFCSHWWYNCRSNTTSWPQRTSQVWLTSHIYGPEDEQPVYLDYTLFCNLRVLSKQKITIKNYRIEWRFVITVVPSITFWSPFLRFFHGPFRRTHGTKSLVIIYYS